MRHCALVRRVVKAIPCMLSHRVSHTLL
jgi:hypothetical protein